MSNTSKLAGYIPVEFAMHNNVCPVESGMGGLTVGMLNPEDEDCIHDLEFMTGLTIEPAQFSKDDLELKWIEIYGEQSLSNLGQQTYQGEFEVLDKNREREADEIKHVSNEWDDVSVVTLVNKIITNAIDSGASDIHIEAYESSFRVRYRKDGVLFEAEHPPKEKKRAIVSRIKIMADLDIAEKRRPQDGRIRVKREERVIDIRVSTLPTDFGEKIVLRILDKSQLNLDLENLGFPETSLSGFKKIVASPYGMILVTGPTGSGKTTTLYATLNHLNAKEVNILTVEDPIEYNLEGINQSQVKSDIGFTFASALRSFLRQDPDIIMVGEIRDEETAEIAIRSALTGHLVLSTLHTNNAPDTLSRLLDMGQEPFLISSSVKMVIAQRLLRTLCPKCKAKDTTLESKAKLKDLQMRSSIPKTFYYGKGCEACNQTGYKGRTAVFEVLTITDAVAEAINHRATARELREIAIQEGMHTLQMSAIEKLTAGLTSVDEVVRETGI